MPLASLDHLPSNSALPRHIRVFLREATRRIQQFQTEQSIPAFVPCDFPAAYSALRAIAEQGLAAGDLFCEWGSGFGVVACLAAMLGFDARGIEIEPRLVDAAQELADDFDIPVEFIQGSFIPAGARRYAEIPDGFTWLTAEEAPPDGVSDFLVEDFDVIFAYPWPDEEQAIANLFERYASAGAVLVTDHSIGGVRLRRKSATKKARRR